MPVMKRTSASVNADPARGASPSMQILTARTINAQRDEITVMQQWLRDRAQPVPEVYTDGTDSTVQVPDEGMRMPGMLTRQQMAELDAARGADFDRLFLTFMIQHHGGAVTMVHDLFATDGAGPAGGSETRPGARHGERQRSVRVGKARKMVTEYGMSGGLGPRTFDTGQDMVFLGKELTQGHGYSDAIAEKIDTEIGSLLHRAQQTAKKALETNKARLALSANRLLTDETIEGPELRKLLSGSSLDDMPLAAD